MCKRSMSGRGWLWRKDAIHTATPSPLILLGCRMANAVSNEIRFLGQIPL